MQNSGQYNLARRFFQKPLRLTLLHMHVSTYVLSCSSFPILLNSCTVEAGGIFGSENGSSLNLYAGSGSALNQMQIRHTAFNEHC